MTMEFRNEPIVVAVARQSYRLSAAAAFPSRAVAITRGIPTRVTTDRRGLPAVRS